MSGGYRKYLENILPRMARHPEVESIICATPAQINIESGLGEVPNTIFTSCKPISIFNSQQDRELEKKLEIFSPDVVYIPIERWFRLKNVPVVISIQNMEPFEYPYNNNPIGEKIKNYFRIRYAREAIDKSDRVIAISKSVRDFLVNKCATPAQKIGVVYHGADSFGENGAVMPVPVPQDIKDNFMFTAGSIRPARGLEDIILAMAHVKRLKGDTPGLVIAGSPDRAMGSYRNMLLNLIGKYSLFSRVFWTGHLNRQEMSWCYQNCSAFIMSSRVESFGQTAVEAMSHGCLCVSADNSCLPEIFGDAAVYYSPGDGESLARKIIDLFNYDKSQSSILSKKALVRAGRFSWEVCAQKTVSELLKTIRY